MNKSELVSAMSAQTGLEKNKTEMVLNAFISVVEDAVSRGDSVQLVGFGTFEQRQREARTGRNPQTGDEIHIPASKVPAFKVGKNFKDLVNGVK